MEDKKLTIEKEKMFPAVLISDLTTGFGKEKRTSSVRSAARKGNW